MSAGASVALDPIRGGYLEVAAARTYFDECGDGPALICVHTGGADSRVFRYLLPLLAELGYRALAPDLPGHGRSFPAGWQAPDTINAHAEFIHEFGRLVCPGERPVALGASVGGLVVLDLAANHSDAYRALVALQAASWMPTFPPTAEVEQPSWLPGWPDLFERLALDASGPAIATDEQVQELRWLHRTCPQISGARDATGWATFDVRGQLGDVSCPVLLGHGLADFLVPGPLVEMTANELGETCEFVQLEGLGHYPMLEDPQRVADLADAFIRRAALA